MYPRSIAPGVPFNSVRRFQLPYYCTPPVTVPDVLGMLAVWRQNKNKNKNQKQTLIKLGLNPKP